MNVKLTGFDRTGIKVKRFFGWKIRELAERYKVTQRTIYRVLEK
jgi:Mor family transcriptional regulator